MSVIRYICARTRCYSNILVYSCANLSPELRTLTGSGVLMPLPRKQEGCLSSGGSPPSPSAPCELFLTEKSSPTQGDHRAHHTSHSRKAHHLDRDSSPLF